MYLSRPFRTILQPYVQPVINKAINIHHNLQDYILIDTFVNCTIEKVQLVCNSTVALYEELEQETKHK